MKLIDIAGQKFGLLTAVRLSGIPAERQSPKWECLCECGRTVYVRGNLLRRLQVRSCGCLIAAAKKKPEEDHQMVGRTFYRLTVLEGAGKDSQGKSLYRCRCDCGVVIVARGTDLRNGNTRACGCHPPAQRRQ